VEKLLAFHGCWSIIVESTAKTLFHREDRKESEEPLEDLKGLHEEF